MAQRRRLKHNIIRTISKSGFCSRKQALELVLSGKVRVNKNTILDPGYKSNKADSILVNDVPLPAKQEKIYILFHKPAGCVTTRKDELGRQTVYSYLKDVKEWLFPVGRLDLESEGLLIFTNDTKFGNMMTDPRFKIMRTYEVWVNGMISASDLEVIRKGIYIGRGETTGKITAKIIGKTDKQTHLELTLTEGKNREIRRIFEHLNRPVIRLLRTSYGTFKLGKLLPGKWRKMAEVDNSVRH